MQPSTSIRDHICQVPVIFQIDEDAYVTALKLPQQYRHDFGEGDDFSWCIFKDLVGCDGQSDEKDVQLRNCKLLGRTCF